MTGICRDRNGYSNQQNRDRHLEHTKFDVARLNEQADNSAGHEQQQIKDPVDYYHLVEIRLARQKSTC